MASIRKEILIDAEPEAVWDALRDWGAPHERLVRGFVLETRLEGRDRIVTFVDGTIAREVFVALDEEARRLVWSVVDGPLTHHNGAAQVFPTDDGRTRFVWIADLLPSEAAERVGAMMEHGIRAVKETLEAAREPTPEEAARRG